LLDKTSGKPVSEALRRNLLSYYADLDKPFATKRNSKAWRELIKELDTLKSTPLVGMSFCYRVTSGDLPFGRNDRTVPLRLFRSGIAERAN
jgi:hypothetical protein